VNGEDGFDEDTQRRLELLAVVLLAALAVVGVIAVLRGVV
jgi:hypothetical protein